MKNFLKNCYFIALICSCLFPPLRANEQPQMFDYFISHEDATKILSQSKNPLRTKLYNSIPERPKVKVQYKLDKATLERIDKMITADVMQAFAKIFHAHLPEENKNSIFISNVNTYYNAIENFLKKDAQPPAEQLIVLLLSLTFLELDHDSKVALTQPTTLFGQLLTKIPQEQHKNLPQMLEKAFAQNITAIKKHPQSQKASQEELDAYLAHMQTTLPIKKQLLRTLLNIGSSKKTKNQADPEFKKLQKLFNKTIKERKPGLAKDILKEAMQNSDAQKNKANINRMQKQLFDLYIAIDEDPLKNIVQPTLTALKNKEPNEKLKYLQSIDHNNLMNYAENSLNFANKIRGKPIKAGLYEETIGSFLLERLAPILEIPQGRPYERLSFELGKLFINLAENQNKPYKSESKADATRKKLFDASLKFSNSLTKTLEDPLITGPLIKTSNKEFGRLIDRAFDAEKLDQSKLLLKLFEEKKKNKTPKQREKINKYFKPLRTKFEKLTGKPYAPIRESDSLKGLAKALKQITDQVSR